MNHYNKITYQRDSRLFSGLIYLSDFDTTHPSGNIVDRIVSDLSFNKQCMINTLNRNQNSKKNKE